MKKVIAGIAVLTLTGAFAIAAPHKGGGRNRGNMERFAEKLNLTDAQSAQIESIKKSSREKNAAFLETHRQTMEQMRAAQEAGDTAKADSLRATLESQRAQMKEIHAAERRQIEALLTSEQRAKLESMKGEGGKRRGGHGAKHRGARGGKGSKFSEELNLTETQKSEVEAIRKSSREQNKAFFESARETHQQMRAARKAGDTAKFESLKAQSQSQRAQMKEIRRAEMQKVLSVLNAEQRARFEAMKNERATRHGRRGAK